MTGPRGPTGPSNAVNFNSTLFGYFATTPQSIVTVPNPTINPTKPISFEQPYNNLSNLNYTNPNYTAPATGQYEFTSNVCYQLTNTNPFIEIIFELKLHCLQNPTKSQSVIEKYINFIPSIVRLSFFSQIIKATLFLVQGESVHVDVNLNISPFSFVIISVIPKIDNLDEYGNPNTDTFTFFTGKQIA